MDKTRAQILGENLKRIRQLKGYSRKELADVIGVNVDAIGKYEKGQREPPLEKIIKLATFLDVTIADLTGENPSFERDIIFEYRYKRAIQLTNIDSFDPTVELADGGIKIFIPYKVTRNKEGMLQFIGDLKSGTTGRNIIFKNRDVFVDVVEKAEQFAAENYIPLYQALNTLATLHKIEFS